MRAGWGPAGLGPGWLEQGKRISGAAAVLGISGEVRLQAERGAGRESRRSSFLAEGDVAAVTATAGTAAGGAAASLVAPLTTPPTPEVAAGAGGRGGAAGGPRRRRRP